MSEADDPGLRSRYAFAPPAPLDELGRSLHALIDHALRVNADHPDALDVLRRAREGVDALARDVGAIGVTAPGLRIGLEGEPAEGRRYWVQGPMVGPHHPMTPPFEIAYEDGETRGHVTFGPAYEGPPGCVHGGYVAWFFDKILGYQNVMSEHRGMTGSLEIKYRRPTPLDTRLHFVVRTLDVRGRATRAAGQLRAGDTVTAEAEGLFIQPRDGYVRP